jgi:hypothetical protein
MRWLQNILSSIECRSRLVKSPPESREMSLSSTSNNELSPTSTSNNEVSSASQFRHIKSVARVVATDVRSAFVALLLPFVVFFPFVSSTREYAFLARKWVVLADEAKLEPANDGNMTLSSAGQIGELLIVINHSWYIWNPPLVLDGQAFATTHGNPVFDVKLECMETGELGFKEFHLKTGQLLKEYTLKPLIESSSEILKSANK